MLKRLKSISLISLVLLLAISMIFVSDDVYGAKKKKKTLKKPEIIKSLKKTSVTQTKIGLKWKKAKRAKRYVVYLSQGKTKKQFKTKKNSITLKGLKQSTKYSITVKAKNKAGFGKASKKLVVRTLIPKPVITSQSPVNMTFDEEEKATLFVKAKGQGLKYRWYAIYTDDTEPVCYSPTFIARYDEDMNTNTFGYYCVVSNKGGSVRSKSITVVMPVKPSTKLKITRQPYIKSAPAAADSLYKGNKISIAIECVNAVSYQWYYDSEEPEGSEDEEEEEEEEFEDFNLFSVKDERFSLMSDIDPQTERKLTGQTSPTLNLTCTQADTGYYFCKVTDTDGKMHQSNFVKITVHGDPDILNNSELENELIGVGRTAKFELETTDAVWYEWQYATKAMYTATPKKWTTFNKTTYGTGKTLTMQNCAATKDSFAIRCIVHGYGPKTAVSKVQRLYVGAEPKLVRKVTSIKVKKGTKKKKLEIIEKAGTSYSTSYQWYKEASGKTTKITNATSKTYTIGTVNASAKYFVKAKNPFTDGEWISSAKITVTVTK